MHNDTDRPPGFEDDQFEEPSSAWSQRCDPLSSGAENKTAAAIGTGLDGYNRTQKRSMADDVSEMLRAWSEGDERALDGLTPIVYAELRRLAHRYMRCERLDHSLQTTALVNEAYIRLVDYKRMRWQDRAHFFAASAQLMRRILVEHARRHNLKRGRGIRHVAFEEAAVISGDPGVDLVALDDALHALARVDPRKVQVVEMRFFGGLSVEETAEALQISPQTVMRDWKVARAWLTQELQR